jgi:hypothetical protein
MTTRSGSGDWDKGPIGARAAAVVLWPVALVAAAPSRRNLLVAASGVAGGVAVRAATGSAPAVLAAEAAAGWLVLYRLRLQGDWC